MVPKTSFLMLQMFVTVSQSYYMANVKDGCSPEMILASFLRQKSQNKHKESTST